MGFADAPVLCILNIFLFSILWILLSETFASIDLFYNFITGFTFSDKKGLAHLQQIPTNKNSPDQVESFIS